MVNRGPELERATLITVAAAAGAAGIGAGIAGGWLPPVGAGVVIAVCGLVGAAAALVASRRRGRALGRFEGLARSIFAQDLGPESPAGAEAGNRFEHAEDVPRLMEPLARAMDQLRARVDSERRELAKKTRNFEALIAAMDEPLLATDNNRRILLCNRSAEAVFGADADELVGRPIGEVFTHAELLGMHDAAGAGEVRRGRVRLTTTLGKRVYQVSASPVPVAWGEGVFGAVMVLRDVTELDQAVQVKTEFVANASHELRTPVAAIRAAAETLSGALVDDPAMAARVSRMIVGHADRLEELLRDLLDLSRLESPDVPPAAEAVDVGALGRALAGMFEGACAERGLRLLIDFDDDLEGMRTDGKLLMLILRNLVENAAKFAFEGTEVRVTGGLVEAHSPGDGEGAPTRGVARFEVADRGIGIPIHQQDRVFERFYQVDPARSGGGHTRGTGLGLAIVKHAAKVLGGRAGVRSVWQQGTTVWVEVEVGFAAGTGTDPVERAS